MYKVTTTLMFLLGHYVDQADAFHRVELPQDSTIVSPPTSAAQLLSESQVEGRGKGKGDDNCQEQETCVDLDVATEAKLPFVCYEPGQ